MNGKPTTFLSFVTLLALLLWGPYATWGQDTALRDEAQPYRIFGVVWRGETEVEEGFRDYLNQRGIPYEFTIRSLELDRSNAPPIVAEIQRVKPDLVYTWGTGSTLSTVGSIGTDTPEKFVQDIPAIFVMVAYPQAAGIIESFESTGRQVSGVSFLAPMDTQLNAITAYYPFQKLAVIYDDTSSNSRLNVELLEKAVGEAEIEFLPLPIPHLENGKPDPEALPDLIRKAKNEQVDVLYMGPDSFLTRHGKMFTSTAIEQGLATFVSTQSPLKNAHGLFGLVSDYYTLGKLAGLQAERILVEGVEPKDLPVAFLSRFKLWVNIDVAKALEIFPPMDIIPIASFNDSGFTTP